MMLAVTISLALMIVTTVVGNILVCLSVVLIKKLRHPSNYLLVSLAISDLCVSILVMPLALYQEANEDWGLGQTVCNMWVSFDVTCCTASILNLCTISIDRYLSITRPLTYGVNASARRSFCFIAGIWIASCLISVPPLLVFGNEHGTDVAPECQVSQNIVYQLYATLGAFYIPLLVMIIMYYKIYKAAKRVVDAELKAHPPANKKKKSTTKKLILRPTDIETTPSLSMNQSKTNKKKKKKSKRGPESVVVEPDTKLESCSRDAHKVKDDENENEERSPLKTTNGQSSESRKQVISKKCDVSERENGLKSCSVVCATFELPKESPTKLNSSQDSMHEVPKEDGGRDQHKFPDNYYERINPNTGIGSSPSLLRTNRRVTEVHVEDKNLKSSALRERKASITLGVIMTAFTVCWLPFFILALLRPFSSQVYNIPRWIVSFALWLGYANSMLNPMIYVTFHQDFRKAFSYLLCCQCATMGTRLREEAYQSQFGCTTYSSHPSGAGHHQLSPIRDRRI